MTNTSLKNTTTRNTPNKNSPFVICITTQTGHVINIITYLGGIGKYKELITGLDISGIECYYSYIAIPKVIEKYKSQHPDIQSYRTELEQLIGANQILKPKSRQKIKS